jgi:hypothetical protein
LLSIKIDINETVSIFTRRIKDMKDKLGDIGEKVSNTDIVTIALNEMLEDYQMFITNLAAREKDHTFEELTGILLQEEERRANLKPQNSDLALWTKKRFPKGKPRKRGRGGSSFQRKSFPKPNQGMSSNRNEPKCFYCGRTGHLAKECYKKKNDDEARHKNRKHSGHFVEKNLNIDSKDLKLFVSNVALFVETDDVDAWFVDSGASIHMTCNKNWYINFKETHNGAHIYLGDDRSYQIKGYGDIPVTLPNGTIRHIHNVVYVPGIKKNLIYVSTITYQNLKVELFKTHCIVKDLQDHYRIIASRVRVGGMYKLDVTNKNHQELTSATMPT